MEVAPAEKKVLTSKYSDAEEVLEHEGVKELPGEDDEDQEELKSVISENKDDKKEIKVELPA